MTSTLELEYKYRAEVGGAVVLLPFTLAKKHTVYPAVCIWHEQEALPAVDRNHLCWKCIDWLREQLAEVARHWPDLEDALSPAGGRAVSSERVTGTGDLYPPLPINGDVSDIMRDARNAVWSTVGQLVQDRPDIRLPADHNTNILADWLARWHVDYLASHPSVGHLQAVGSQLARVARSMQEAAYQSPPVEVPLDGRCHQTGCSGEVVAVQTPDGRRVVRCSEDITHRVAADQWFQSHARRAPRPARAMNTLKKKYLTGRNR